MKKILVILSKYHLKLYRNGFLNYAKEQGVIIEFFELHDCDDDNILYRKAYKKNILGYRDDINAKQSRYLETVRKEYDSFLFINFPEESKKLLRVLSENEDKNILFVDTMRDLKEIQGLEKFRNIYSFEYNDIKYAKQKWGITVNYTPIGTSYHLYNVINREPQYDISFVCLASEKRLAYLDKIADYCYKNNRILFCAGHFWHNGNFLQRLIGALKFRRKHPILYKYVKNEYLTPEQLAQVYIDSKICLNINIEKHHSFNTRNFDVMVLGRLLITDEEDLTGIDVIPGEELVMSKGIEDMIERIGKYLRYDEERVKIAKKASIKVKDKYCFNKTMKMILN